MTGHKNVRYALVSILCAATHNIVMIGGAALGLHYAVTSVASFVINVALGFLLHSHFTFSMTPDLRSFWRYAAAMAMNLPIWLVLMFLLADLCNLPMAVASPVGTVVLALWNYVASHWALLRREPK